VIGRARVLTAAEVEGTAPQGLAPPHDGPRRLPAGRIVTRAVVEASAEAERLLGQARAEARRLLDAAARDVAELEHSAKAKARAEASAALSAQALALATLEAKADERSLDRTVALARLLAERLLGASLAVAPEQIAALARQALAEAHGARRITLVAHPNDVAELDRSLGSLGVAMDTLSITPDPRQARGSLRIETEIGVLDADLGLQLDRLALRLRETLSHD
jgi:type III secretion protein L